MTLDAFVILIVIGAAAGLLANALVRSARIGFIGAIIIGIVGAFFGNWLFDRLNIRIAANPFIASVLMAFVGSVILLLLLGGIRRS